MKKQINSALTGRISGKAWLVAAFLSTASVAGAAAQTNLYASNELARESSASVVRPASLQAAVYQVENTTKVKVHFENATRNPVTLRIRNAADQVVHEEVIRDQKYIRKFDLDQMADGNYTFEISNKTESLKKEIELQTQSARTMHINE